MSGIVFLKTTNLKKITDFYINSIGCRIWMDQGDCIILSHGNFLLGFCEREKTDRDGILTFFYESREEVDEMYQQFQDIAVSPPEFNRNYPIYNFFAKDPDGRDIEFQSFTEPIDCFLTGEEVLLQRRSVREFKNKAVSEEILNRLVEISRFAPTSRNSESYYFKIIKDADLIKWLSETRGTSSAPICRTDVAIVVCADPNLSKRHIQDGCIAAYHFILAAKSLGLGTCWIAAMDREDLKDKLNIPQDHYVATITPLGYPAQENIRAPKRKERDLYIR